LKNIIVQLALKGFIQIHKSYIINTSKVDYFLASSLVINQIMLPVGRKYKPILAKYLDLNA